MPQLSIIASNGVHLEKLGHFVPNLSQSNSSLGPGYAVGIKAKTRAKGKLYQWPGERGKGGGPFASLSPSQTSARLASLATFFFAHADFFLLFPPVRSLVPG